MSTRANVILIMTDDQGYGDLACHGNPVAQTPHLDALHAASVRLDDFHVAPMCTPTRGQLLTGLDAARNGAENVSSGRTLLRPELPTMADHFRAGGYRTGLFGKWHLGDNYPFRPQDRGFEETLWFPSSHISSAPDHWENDYFDDIYSRNGTRERYEGYCTEVFFREAQHWMHERIAADEPFFAYLPTNAPHAPHFVPREDREAMEAYFAQHEAELGDYNVQIRDRIIRFLAMIRNLDRAIGGLRDFLEEEGAAENTILIFLTDNGSTFGPAYYNAGMQGGKCTLWEGGHRVPCFIHWPQGGFGAPRDIAGLTQVQDLLPTLAACCDLDLGALPLDGISLLEVLRGEEAVPEDRILCVNYSRMPHFDYPTPASQAVMRREGAAVMWQRWRLLAGTALYDLEADPEQQHNCIEEQPAVAARMRAALDEWWAEVEGLANQSQYIIIGSEHENPCMLSACDWWDVFLDRQGQVRLGINRNSYWHIEVARAGTYRFRLRRWPVEAGLALDAACAETVVTDGVFEAGEALPITGARLCIDDQCQHCACEPGADCAAFTVELAARRRLLHTWFLDTRGQSLCGAYYVYIERL